MIATTSDLKSLREAVSHVLDVECGSRDVHSFVDGQTNLEKKIWSRASALGWFSAGISEPNGGLGLGVLGLDVLHREFGRHLAPGPFISTLCAATLLSEVGTELQKSQYLEGIGSGEIRVAVPALDYGTNWSGKPNNIGSDSKTGSMIGPMLGSDQSELAVIPHNLPDGCPAFALLEKGAMSLTRMSMWDPLRQVCSVHVEDIESADVVRDPNGTVGARLFSLLALAIAGDSMGLADAVFRQTLEFMKTRVQFDRPIGAFQALKHRVADMATMIAIQDQLTAHALDNFAADEPDANMWTILAKAGSTDAACHIATECLQLHGGVGFTWEFDIHLYLKRARLNEMLVATNSSLRDVAADMLTCATRDARSTTGLKT